MNKKGRGIGERITLREAKRRSLSYLIPRPHPSPSYGFTLIEVMITISILVIIVSVILVQSRTSRSTTLLINDAYEVALMLREAQSYGSSVREGGGSTPFDVGYGVHVSTGQSGSILLFNDVNKDMLFTGTDGDAVRTYTLSKGNTISDFCVSNGGSPSCNVSSVTISFIRPSTDAHIIANGDEDTEYQEATITVSSSDGEDRTITVNATGQISVEQ